MFLYTPQTKSVLTFLQSCQKHLRTSWATYPEQNKTKTKTKSDTYVLKKHYNEIAVAHNT